MSSVTAHTTALLPSDAKPPKSKSASYYSVHPLWQDIKPIPQMDQSGALAPIAYSPRYSEAMSYLRALMADNEVSERALGLTEDLISMNPAHYTVWIYRMRILKGLWSESKGADAEAVEVKDDKTAGSGPNEINDELWDKIQAELQWLDEVSFRNLKNYQIWHHRHGLADLLPADSTSTTTIPSESSKQASISDETRSILALFISSEQIFLARILLQDTKNYHVWSYRQWLCSRFPSFLLPSYSISIVPSIASSYRSHAEVAAIDLMIEDDVRNNSAWSHRYFILFGHHELSYAQSQTPPLILKTVNEEKLLHKAGRVDMQLVEAEVEYTKARIREAPQNGSSWNYLRGVLRHGAVDVVTLRHFCEEFLGPDGDLWMDQWVDVEVEDSTTGQTQAEKQQLGVRSSHAVEWLSEIYGKDTGEAQRLRSKECLKALGEKWDIIRKGYWVYRLQKQEEEWSN